MAKWIFYVLVFVYMCYRAVYGATSILVDEIDYEDDGYLNAGTRKTVTCRGTNKNQKLEWVDPFDNVVKRIPKSRVYAQENSANKGNRSPSLGLTFTELLPSDTGMYQCQSGNQKKSVRVCVLKPLEFVDSEDTPTEVTIEAGRSITLACQAKGEPEPKLLWGREKNDENGNYVYLKEGDDSPKYKVNRRYKREGYESLLTIVDVEPADAGTYHCIANQESPMLDKCGMADSKNLTLTVNYQPEFENDDEAEFVYGANSEIVNIKCEADGNPPPTYRWFKDLGGDALYEFNKSKIEFSDGSAILAVTAGPTTYGKIYKCTASNIFGETEKSFKLLRRETPSQADSVKLIDTTDNSVYLFVKWDHKVSFPVDSYSVQYIPSSKIKSKILKNSDWINESRQVEVEAEEDAVVKEVGDEEEDNDDEENGEGSVIKLTNLDPETEYFVRVRAVNEAGMGPWSDVSQITTIQVSTNEENTEAPESVPTEDSATEASTEKSKSAPEDNSDRTGMFYGIFFTGAILIVAVVCMFAMRIV